MERKRLPVATVGLDGRDRELQHHTVMAKIQLQRKLEGSQASHRKHQRPSVCKAVKKRLILKEINPEYSLEGLMLKLKLLYFGYLM